MLTCGAGEEASGGLGVGGGARLGGAAVGVGVGAVLQAISVRESAIANSPKIFPNLAHFALCIHSLQYFKMM